MAASSSSTTSSSSSDGSRRRRRQHRRHKPEKDPLKVSKKSRSHTKRRRRRHSPSSAEGHSYYSSTSSSEVDRESVIREFWLNNLRQDAEDELDQMMIMLLEEEEQRSLEAAKDWHDRLVCDYFSDDPTFKADTFRRRFRMRRVLFLHIVDALEKRSDYFKWNSVTVGKKSLSPLQKCTIAIRQLAYASPGDSLDEYIQISERTTLDCLDNFCRCVIDVFGARYLRRPNDTDTQCLVQMHEQRHKFRGMLGSLDCIQWKWKNCPNKWKGQYTLEDHTIILQAVVSADLWIWHAFFGATESCNDMNLLYGSPLFNAILQGYAPEVNFTVNHTSYTKGYYLTDETYPEWTSFVKGFLYPLGPKRKKFKERHEAARQDVERAFKVLQSRWAIVRDPARSYYKIDLRNIMYTCIILHNMIIENEGDEAVSWLDEHSFPATTTMSSMLQFPTHLHYFKELQDRETHHQLRADLVEHMWAH